MTTGRARVAVLGAGGIGSTAHLPALAALPDDAETVAIGDTDSARLASAVAAFGGEGFEDAGRMLREVAPDIVVVATPPHTHTDLAIASLEAGAWVYCQKPMCGSLRDADRIIEAESRTGGWCVGVSQFRYCNGSAEVLEALSSGRFGKPLVCSAETAWYRGPAYWDAPWRGLLRTEYGGATTTQAYHAIDLLLALMGPWTEVVAFSGALGRPIEVEDTSAGAIRFASGALGSMLSTVLSHREHSRIAVHAELASFELETLYHPTLRDWTVTRHDADRGAVTVEDWAPSSEAVPAHQVQTAQLIASWRAGRKPELTAAEVRPMLELLTALYKSADSGTAVPAGSIRPGDPYYEALSGRAELAG
jgi:predicted dehydrogenase